MAIGLPKQLKQLPKKREQLPKKRENDGNGDIQATALLCNFKAGFFWTPCRAWPINFAKALSTPIRTLEQIGTLTVEDDVYCFVLNQGLNSTFQFCSAGNFWYKK